MLPGLHPRDLEDLHRIFHEQGSVVYKLYDSDERGELIVADPVQLTHQNPLHI